jgi:hypothetical protein
MLGFILINQQEIMKGSVLFSKIQSIRVRLVHGRVQKVCRAIINIAVHANFVPDELVIGIKRLTTGVSIDHSSA